MDEDLAEVLKDCEVDPAKVEAVKQSGEAMYLAVDTKKKGKNRTAFLCAQMACFFDGSGHEAVPSLIKRSDIEAAYIERMSLGLLRPTKFNWTTGVDGLSFKSGYRAPSICQKNRETGLS